MNFGPGYHSDVHDVSVKILRRFRAEHICPAHTTRFFEKACCALSCFWVLWPTLFGRPHRPRCQNRPYGESRVSTNSIEIGRNAKRHTYHGVSRESGESWERIWQVMFASKMLAPLPRSPKDHRDAPEESAQTIKELLDYMTEQNGTVDRCRKLSLLPPLTIGLSDSWDFAAQEIARQLGIGANQVEEAWNSLARADDPTGQGGN